ncbi:MAG: four helix bundle protein [Salinimicrobium sediminis]|uniref:Four helix bundle protein n=1 Tax=Salinimicrobium sediminis TaxID=1343891 RepID=A0A285X6J0_9FLAO|nr:four helix bundle protein [Salinimicrobium sediminis]MDX1602856.1 four helix bundle protein [Salinimicrobium sediminis]MDX1754168.1 four helix bundle protein [Salinimicrobium sediminis]SOC80963.1 four helix bundle protein [Salinimicrobium sediminis]
MAQSYKELEIYSISLTLFYKIHSLSLQLPKHELYELGSQIRRSADSVNTNIVEGYGRRRYKADFLKFLVYSHASNDETLNHLEKLVHLYPGIMKDHLYLQKEYNSLGGKINSFIKYVETSWKS